MTRATMSQRPTSLTNRGAHAGDRHRHPVRVSVRLCLLQKCAAGTYHILIGQLLLQDWTVVKIMATAIGVGMVCMFVLNRLGKVNMRNRSSWLPTSLAGCCSGSDLA